MSNPDKTQRIWSAMLVMAPAFRDKFDFADTTHYDQLAEHAYKSAKALVEKAEKEGLIEKEAKK